jgi:hypothetical protein
MWPGRIMLAAVWIGLVVLLGACVDWTARVTPGGVLAVIFGVCCLWEAAGALAGRYDR